MKLHLREPGKWDTPVCHKLPTFHAKPEVTGDKRMVTCKRCKIVYASRMRKLEKELVGA